MYLIDRDGIVLETNEIGAKGFGVTTDELVGKSIFDFMTPEVAKRRSVIWAKMEEKKEHIRLVDERDGTYYESIVAPRFDEHGNIIGASICAREATERLETDKALQVSEERYRALFDNMSSCVAIYRAVEEGMDFEFTDFNKAAEKAENFKKQDLIDRRVTDVFPGIVEMGLLEVFQRVWKTGQSEQFPITFYQDDRIKGWRENFVAKLPTGEIVAVYEDITERKQAEQAVLAALEDAKIANRTKSEFLANMSHELRTPLNAIIGFSGSIKEESFGPIGHEKYNEYLDYIGGSAEHLLDLINDILDVSAIEAGKLVLYEEPINVPDLVTTPLRLINHRASQGEVRLNGVIDENIPDLNGDTRRMKQVLLNLLSNGVKFTQPGGEVSLEASFNEDIGHVFKVTDNGIGMDAAELDKALASFGQVDRDTAEKLEGTGLGLPLTKGLVELHGGTLDISSDKGVGTVATVILPISKTA